MDLQLQDESGGDISSFVTNGEWELLGIKTLQSHYDQTKTKQKYLLKQKLDCRQQIIQQQQQEKNNNKTNNKYLEKKKSYTRENRN